MFALLPAAALASLLRDPGAPVGRLRAGAARLALFTLCAAVVSWIWPARPHHPLEFAPPLSEFERWSRFGAAGALGAAGAALLRPRLAAWGLLAGLIFAAMGRAAYDWATVAHAWRLIGWFAGSFLSALLPLLLAAALAALAAALFHPGLRPHRAGAAAAVILGWSAPAGLARWHLESSWGLGPRDLAQAAGLPSESQATVATVLWLRPSPEGPVRREQRRLSAEGVEAAPPVLERLGAFLAQRNGRHVFARQALKAQRRGWLALWMEDEALEAAATPWPGVAAPDYLTALGLIRAGPLTLERFRRLDELARAAEPRREGFEDVNTSQLIFEAFSAAYARFGEEEGARSWLYMVDNLWPIYDKKVEATPLESFQDGAISGSVSVAGERELSAALRVGLFYVSSSTPNAEGTLSQAAVPLSDGRFSFTNLGAGSYYLGLLGPAELLDGRVLNPTGLLELSPEAPRIELPPIRLEPDAALPPPGTRH